MTPTYPRWMSIVLLLAGAYNLAWGSWVVFAPTHSFAASGLSRPGVPLDYPQLWQCIGMIVGVYGIGYACAAIHPVRHWPVVLVGFLGKVFGPLGFAYGFWTGTSRIDGLLTHVFNDLIWLIPFALILQRAAWAHRTEADAPPAEPFETVAADYRDAFGVSLLDLTRRSPVLVVFVRHFGCTYCREAVADLAKARPTVEAAGVRVAVVHMGTPAEGDDFLTKYGMADVPRFSDPAYRLYRSVGLGRGSFWQHFGPKSLVRLASAGKYGVGRVVGDGFRMPGAFLVHHGKVVRDYKPETVADPFDYCGIAGCRTGAA
jgi:peroxiredoxin